LAAQSDWQFTRWQPNEKAALNGRGGQRLKHRGREMPLAESPWRDSRDRSSPWITADVTGSQVLVN
jgi:hypothetical protein